MAQLKCILCNASTTQTCTRCHSISYCSQACQKADWPLHKHLCRDFSTLGPRPSPTHKLAIVLPVVDAVPKLAWVECEEIVEECETYELADTKALLDEENLNSIYESFWGRRQLQRNPLRGHQLSHTVRVFWREHFLNDGSSPNGCVRAITDGKMGYDWRGPVVLMRLKGTASDPSHYEDVRAGDLRIAADYFITYKKTQACQIPGVFVL